MSLTGRSALLLIALFSNIGTESVPTENYHHFSQLGEVYATLQSLNSLLKEVTLQSGQ